MLRSQVLLRPTGVMNIYLQNINRMLFTPGGPSEESEVTNLLLN